MDLRIQDLPFDPATRHRRAPGPIASDHHSTHGAGVERLDAFRPARAAPAGATVSEPAPSMLADARGCQPAAVARRVAERPADRDALGHRVAGHGIGRATETRLRAAFRPPLDTPRQPTP